MVISLLLLGFGWVLSKCYLEVPLVSKYWSTSNPTGEEILFFCNHSVDKFECPNTPPNLPSSWLQLVSPYSGTDTLSYTLPEECRAWKYFEFSLVNLGIVSDDQPNLSQNATLSILTGTNSWSLSIGPSSNMKCNWTNVTQVFTGDPTWTTTLDHDKFTIQLVMETSVHRELTVVIIGGVIIQTY